QPVLEFRFVDTLPAHAPQHDRDIDNSTAADETPKHRGAATVCQGARESAANSSAAPKWTTVGVPNAAEPSGEASVFARSASPPQTANQSTRRRRSRKADCRALYAIEGEFERRRLPAVGRIVEGDARFTLVGDDRRDLHGRSKNRADPRNRPGKR